MTEFIPAPINNTLSSVRLLTNVSGGPAFLNLYNAKEGTVGNTVVSKELCKHFKPNESVFFHDILVDEPGSALYNGDKITSYINQNILSDSYFVPTPPSITVLGTTNNTHSLALSISDTFEKTSASNQLNHLSVSYVLDSFLAYPKVIAYRDVDGISYSEDGGLSCIKIPNTSLLYPNEITSYAIQAYTSTNTSAAKSKIFIGTLREGLKSFTINQSTSWEQEGSDEMILTGDTPLVPDAIDNLMMFKYSFSNVTTSDSNYPPPMNTTNEDVLYDYIGVDYAPCYVLAVNNYPLSAGNGILVFVNNGIVERKVTSLGSNFIIVEPKYLYLFKYLHESSKQYSSSGRGFTETPEKITEFINWTSICDPTTRIAYSNSPVKSTTPFPIIYDQLKQIPLTPSQTYNSTVSGDLIAVTEQESISYVSHVYSLTGLTHIEGIQERSLQFTQLPSLNLVHSMESSTFKGLSTAVIDNNVFIFMTDNESVWYCNLTSQIPLWSQLLGPENLYLDSTLSLATSGARTYLSGLTGFGVLPSRKLTGNLIGILGSDFGYLQCNIVNTNGVLSLKSGSLQVRANLHSNYLRDILVISDKNLILSCGFELELLTGYSLPNTYGKAKKYSLLMPSSRSTLPTTLSSSDISILLYKNFTSPESPDPVFYNSSNIASLPEVHNTDQSYDVQFVYSSAVQANHEILNPPSYVSGYSTNLINKLVSAYTTAIPKHQKTSILIRATENVVVTDETPISIQSELELPYLPEISYTAAVSVPGYSYTNIPFTCTSFGVHGTVGTSSVSMSMNDTGSGAHGIGGTSEASLLVSSHATATFSVYGGYSIASIGVQSTASGIFTFRTQGSSTVIIIPQSVSSGIFIPKILGTSVNNIIPQSVSSGIFIPKILGTSVNNIIPQSNISAIVANPVTGSSFVNISIISSGIGVRNNFSINNIPVTSLAVGRATVTGTSVNNFIITTAVTGLQYPTAISSNTIRLTTSASGMTKVMGTSTTFVVPYTLSTGYMQPTGTSVNIMTTKSSGYTVFGYYGTGYGQQITVRSVGSGTV